MDAENRLIGDIYDAALDTSLWPRVMAAIAQRAGAVTANIIAMDVLNPAYNLILPHNIPAACFEEYATRGWNRVDMQIFTAAAEKYELGTPHNTLSLFGSVDNARETLGDYYRFLDKWGMTSQAGALLDRGDFRWSVLGVHRPGHMGIFGEDTLAFLGRVAGHLRRALQIHRQLVSVRNENSRLYAMLDGMVSCVMLLDGSARIRYANPRAASLVRTRDTLVIRQDGTLATHAGQNGDLQALVNSAIGTSRRTAGDHACGNHGGVIGLTSPRHDTPLMLTVTPLSSLASWQDLRHDDIAAAIFLTDPAQGIHLASRLLRDNYGLSQREAEICELFANHPSFEAVAELGRLSVSSVRTYFKKIYEKTGQRSQAELLRLLMGLRVDFEHIR